MRKIILFNILFLFFINISYAQNTTLKENPGMGLNYISARIDPAPQNYTYGVSFYTHVWPLVYKPIAGLQIGLPSIWIIPDNKDFNQPLCPPGTFAQASMPKQGPYYRDVFQTIEGGLGYWRTTQFPNVVPKYGIGGTPDCYTNKIGSSNWMAGKTTTVPANLMGIAQLSNHIIIPPDGMTFSPKTNDALIGFAWMALPLMGDNQSWTLFINSNNFSGPVAFYLPQTWSRLSKTYPVINNRGLDVRPGIMNGGSMEINSIPYFESKDKTGVTYSRIPWIMFPVDKNRQTPLMQDIYYYSKNAIYNPMKNNMIPNHFETDNNSAWTPTCTAYPIKIKQGPQNILLSNIDSTVQTFALNQNGKCLFGLQWTNAKPGTAIFPNYFKQVGNTREAISEQEVPNDTQLKLQQFRQAVGGQTYNSPWGNGPASRDINVKLSDGSIVTYRWYRFVDQPVLQNLNLTDAEKNDLQNKIIKLHKAWVKNMAFMPTPSQSSLAHVDQALLVTPPKGMEYGYVPIVIRQGKTI